MAERTAELKAANQQLHFAAQHDALTELPNRTLFTDHLERSIRRVQQSKDHLFAVLFLDLDRFKVINDSLGHTVGDQLLIATGRRLEACVRSEDVVARLGGDEFAILLNDIKHPNDAIRVADGIQKELASPIDLNGHRVFTTASIGIALSAIAYDQPADLLRNADVAMYRAKAQGRARHEVFDVSMYDYAIARWQLESDLHRAVERQEFRVYYQPFVSLTSGEMTGVEALLRWQHPKHGLVDPIEFIPLAEETGLIEPIGEWTLRTACAQATAWQTAGYLHLQVAVNVSPRQLAPPASVGKHPSLNEAVRAALRETGIPPQALGLEITDSAAVPEGGFAILSELSALGIGISLDDFGLGSSLDCLKRFPLNTLKIDQSFVASMTSVPSDQVIITEIISMAHKLNLKVIAEGVETKEQLDALRSKQCDEIQGNLFSEPLPAEALTKLLQEGRRLPL